MAPDQGTAQATAVRTACLPTYLVIDSSHSMKPCEQLLNDSATQITETLLARPRVGDFMRLSVIGFNDEAQLLRGMTDDVDGIVPPRMACTGSARYAPMLDLLRRQADLDVPTLSTAGLNILRPLVIFWIDRPPADRPEGSWLASLARLTETSWHPHVIAYGFDPSAEPVLRKVANQAAFLADDALTSKQQAVSSALTSVLRLLIVSAQKKQLQIPQAVAGFRPLL